MLIRKVTLLMITLLATMSVALSAQTAARDLSGAWVGKVVTERTGAQPKVEDAYFVLKQTGKVVTGTTGPTADNQLLTVTKGSVELTAGSTAVTLEFEVQGTLALRIEMKLVDGHLKGNMQPAGAPAGMVLKVDLERVK